MKLHLFALALISVFVISSCKKGDQGPAGHNSLTRTSAEPAGTNCATGGTKIETGIDANDNGTLDNNEVNAAQTKYVCNGATGAQGSAGAANVIYSNWQNLDMGGSGSSWQTILTTAIPPAIVNTGVTLCYIKDATGNIHQLRYESSTGTYITYFLRVVSEVVILDIRSNVESDVPFRYVAIPGSVQIGRFVSGPAAGYTPEQLQAMSYEAITSLLKIPPTGTNIK